MPYLAFVGQKWNRGLLEPGTNELVKGCGTMITGIDPKIDYAFKRVFGVERNRDLLIHLIHSVLRPSPEDQITDIELLDPFSEKETITDRVTILDIKARDQRGGQFNIEMQMIAHAFFLQRILYYWAKFHQQQIQEGYSYSVLRPTVSICFLNDTLFPEIPEYHLAFQLMDPEYRVQLCRDITIHLIELPKFKREHEDLADPLDRWLYFLVNGEQLDRDTLPPQLDMLEIRHAMEELEMLTKNELERERYENRLKAIRDDIARRETALELGLTKGRAEGREEGREEGLAKGEMIGRIHALEAILGEPNTPRETLLAKATEDLRRLAEQLVTEFQDGSAENSR